MARLDLRIAGCEALLSLDEKQRAARYRRDQDRARFIATRARLRHLLAERVGIAPDALEIVRGPNGKPVLAASDLQFSVSRSEDVAAFAFARGRKVGVDIEAIRPLPEADAIAAGAFSAVEHAAYRALPEREKLEGFFNCWTRKEAFVKALGQGLSLRLDGFDVTLAPGEPAKLLRVGQRSGEDAGWRLARRAAYLRRQQRNHEGDCRLVALTTEGQR